MREVVVIHRAKAGPRRGVGRRFAGPGKKGFIGEDGGLRGGCERSKQHGCYECFEKGVISFHSGSGVGSFVALTSTIFKRGRREIKDFKSAREQIGALFLSPHESLFIGKVSPLSSATLGLKSAPNDGDDRLI